MVAASLFKGHDSIHVIDVLEGNIRYKFRPRLPKKQKDIIVQRLIPIPHNSHQVIVMDSDSRGVFVNQ